MYRRAKFEAGAISQCDWLTDHGLHKSRRVPVFCVIVQSSLLSSGVTESFPSFAFTQSPVLLLDVGFITLYLVFSSVVDLAILFWNGNEDLKVNFINWTRSWGSVRIRINLFIFYDRSKYWPIVWYRYGRLILPYSIFHLICKFSNVLGCLNSPSL